MRKWSSIPHQRSEPKDDRPAAQPPPSMSPAQFVCSCYPASRRTAALGPLAQHAFGEGVEARVMVGWSWPDGGF